MKYGERLKAARKHKKWTQDDLSDATGGEVCQAVISKIERGEQKSNSKYDPILADVLDIHAKWLSDGDERYLPEWLGGNLTDFRQRMRQESKLKDDEIELLQAYNGLTPSQKKAVIQEIKQKVILNIQDYQNLKELFENGK